MLNWCLDHPPSLFFEVKLVIRVCLRGSDDGEGVVLGNLDGKKAPLVASLENPLSESNGKALGLSDGEVDGIALGAALGDLL